LDLVQDLLDPFPALGDRALMLGERLDDGSELLFGYLGETRQSLLTDDLFDPAALDVGIARDGSIGSPPGRTVVPRSVSRKDLRQTVEQTFVAPAVASFDLGRDDVYPSLAEPSFERQFKLSFLALRSRSPKLIYRLLFDPSEKARILELFDEATLIWHGFES
jgi:hypothetical protein